ncbi:MAG: hypothetical protein K0S75_1062 [Clostridia bacterium]|nr:hypothetical protein [Clostridia bacterium]
MFYSEDTGTLLPGQINNITKPLSKYTNPIYNVSLMYPTQWAKVNSLHYAGIDGYFRISVLESDMSLEEICKIEAYHKLEPYGSDPTIVSDTSAGQDVCLIVPSEDQPTDMKRQTALVIKYPNGLNIDSETYSHLILWTDMEHLQDIKNSLIIED